MQTTESSPTEKAVAFFVMSWALGWVAHYRSIAPDDLVALAVTGLIGLGGIAVAAAVWQAKRSATASFVIWAAADVLGLVFLDARVEPVWGSVILAGLGATAVLGVFGLLLVGASRRRRTELQ